MQSVHIIVDTIKEHATRISLSIERKREALLRERYDAKTTNNEIIVSHVHTIRSSGSPWISMRKYSAKAIGPDLCMTVKIGLANKKGDKYTQNTLITKYGNEFAKYLFFIYGTTIIKA